MRTNEGKGKAGLFILIPIVQIVFLIIIIYFIKSQENVSARWNAIPVMFFVSCVLADFMLYFYERQLRKHREAQIRNEQINKELLLQMEHYERLIKQLDSMAKIRHDFGNYMQTVYALIDRKEYDEAGDMLNKLYEKISADGLENINV